MFGIKIVPCCKNSFAKKNHASFYRIVLPFSWYITSENTISNECLTFQKCNISFYIVVNQKLN